ncbi:polysaccharide pyruvyl transferase family protein [Paenibacillus thermoaerophilus]|uniref:Polysaccharide pyruvyl transferase family protein n=1 Tax=Paenibacillus thermoaerophilus TaxID=1215385 RepID=A0ABW2V796_9BACL|nr:polysaccharide pyruvyl transferase family protein [Paenibacillus thermoaerophilus]TMV16155.1 exopolysaccharide biosynthesis protein [Paenibacillus thermoaerophilus]
MRNTIDAAPAAAVHPMLGLKKSLRQILKAIPAGSDMYYIDYPVYGNVGDMLILKGAERFFGDNGIRVRARYSADDFEPGIRVPDSCIIVLQGGGNFGDLYPRHQKLRESIVERYPGHRIVILPQTIHFNDEHAYDRTAELFNRHRDLHLFIRDREGFERAKGKFTCNLYLSPDMAHQLYPIAPERAPDKEWMRFLRTDRETNEAQLRAIAGLTGEAFDWDTMLSRSDKRIIYWMGRAMRSRLRAGRLPLQKIWYGQVDRLTGKAIRLFSSYRKVATSRLHGHILCCLMDKENVLFDNSYGKNSNYYRTWTHVCPNARLESF